MSEAINITLPVDTLEGTTAKVLHWLVSEGDEVNRGMPLLELETDKVTMEICAEERGIVETITAQPGADVAEGDVLGLLLIKDSERSIESSTGFQSSKVQAPTSATQPSTPSSSNTLQSDRQEESKSEVDSQTSSIEIDQAKDTIAEVHQLVQNVEPSSLQVTALPGSEYHSLHAQAVSYPGHSVHHHPPYHLQGSARHLIGPAVRRLLKEQQLDINLIEGSGRGGRVTRNDVLAFLAEGGAHKNYALALAAASVPVAKTPHQSLSSPSEAQSQALTESDHTAKPMADSGICSSRMVPHSNMRKAIANHMVDSLLNISPHVTSVFEMDMKRVIEHRNQCKIGFVEAGINLTFTAYFLIAAAKAMAKVPQVNARFHDDALEIFDDINIGVGTALGDDGLVVPVIKQVQQKNLFQIASVLQQQTDKARAGKLTPADMKGGTFTISNHGVSGSLFATPIIINQPQVAILGIGKLEKRAVVEEIDGEDVIKIRPKCYVSLSIDHRALDAHQTNLFLSHFVAVIEQWGNDDTFSNRQVDPSRL